MDLLSESCEEGEEFLYWVTKMSQYFEDKFVQISMNFWLSFTNYFSEDRLIGLGMPPFYRPYLGNVRQEIIVMIMIIVMFNKTSHIHTLHIQAIYKHTY